MDRRRFLSLAVLTGAGTLLARSTQTGNAAPAASVSASMWLYPWDLADEGYSTVMTRLREHGLTSVSVATAYHAGRFLAPHNPKRKIVFLEDGTVYFAPAMHLYGRIKPIVNSMVREGHNLQRIKREADGAGLATRAWVVCCHNSALGSRHQDCTLETAFGDRLIHSLCPANPMIRSYLKTLVRDIATTGVSAIELEAVAFPGYDHGYHHERDGIPLTAGIRFLLSLCFCPSCLRQAGEAGVDTTSVRSYVRRTLEEYFAAPELHAGFPVSIDDLPSDPFSPFLQWRVSAVTELVRELATAPAPLTTRIRPIVALDPNARRQAGVDIEAMAALTGGVLVPGYVRNGDALRDPLNLLITAVHGREITIGFQVGLPESGGREEFESRVAIARAAGITSFNFYNYGLISLDRLPWIRDSLQPHAR
jgi:hypothetical protein